MSCEENTKIMETYQEKLADDIMAWSAKNDPILGYCFGKGSMSLEEAMLLRGYDFGLTLEDACSYLGIGEADVDNEEGWKQTIN